MRRIMNDSFGRLLMNTMKTKADLLVKDGEPLLSDDKFKSTKWQENTLNTIF